MAIRNFNWTFGQLIITMPQSRKRPGHHEFKKTADIPSSQRTNGKFIWALLFGIFGFLLTYFASGLNYSILIIATVIAAVLGFIIGRSMELAASKKQKWAGKTYDIVPEEVYTSC